MDSKYLNRLRLIDLIIAVLQAHGDSLLALSNLLTEEGLIHALELAGDTYPESPIGELLTQLKLDPAHPDETVRLTTPYIEIETAVRDLKLPATLEFYVWTYPHYRSLIESSLDLNLRFSKGSDSAQVNLVEELVRQSRQWVRGLPLPPTESFRAEKSVEPGWLRFRTRMLPKLGSKSISVL